MTPEAEAGWWMYGIVIVLAMPLLIYGVHRWRVRRKRSLAKLYGPAFYFAIKYPRPNTRWERLS
jgi:hypothetical protein